jgi:predicted DNA-binding transcriptional regulator AlpA
VNFVDPSPDDLTPEEAARIAGVSARTLRRAIRRGALPRRYVIGPRGWQLVFRRKELDPWCAERALQQRGRRYVRQASRGPVALGDLRAELATLRKRIDDSRASRRQLAALLETQEQILAEVQEALSRLAVMLARPE